MNPKAITGRDVLDALHKVNNDAHGSDHAWIDHCDGPRCVTIDGTFDLDAVAAALTDKLRQGQLDL